MIFITAKFKIRPEDADKWPQIAAEFTEATRSEPGCLWFDWSRSLDDPEHTPDHQLLDPAGRLVPARRASRPRLRLTQPAATARLHLHL